MLRRTWISAAIVSDRVHGGACRIRADYDRHHLGHVRDQQGGVIPSATVVLISEARGTKSAPAMTNATGNYDVSERDGGYLHGRSEPGRLQDGAPRRHPRQRRRPRRRAGHYAGNRRHRRDRERHGGNRDGAERRAPSGRSSSRPRKSKISRSRAATSSTSWRSRQVSSRAIRRAASAVRARRASAAPVRTTS